MDSMTGKHIFLLLFGGAAGATAMHFWMKREAMVAKPTASTSIAGLQYVPEQIKRY